MPEGFDLRPVVESRAPSGQANVPARQLGLVSVQAPRGGNMSQVGAGQRALAESVKMGGQLLDGYLKKKEAKDIVTGEMLRAQGKTEQELRDAGYNSTVLKGYQTLKMKTEYSNFMAKMQHSAVNEHAGLDSETFRTQILSPQFNEVLDGLDPNDDLSRKLFTDMGKEGFAKLIKAHTTAHVQHMDSESTTILSNMLYAAAGTGDPEEVASVLGDWDEFTKGMSDDNKRGSILGGMVPQLNEGNFLIYDQLGGAQGLREKGFTPEQMETVTNAVKRAQSVRESSIDSDFNDRVDDIKIQSKEGRIGPQEAAKQLRELQSEYRTSDEWVRGIVKQVREESFDRKLEDRERVILHDPDYNQAIAQLTILAAQEGNTARTTNAALAISEKFDVPHDMVVDNLELVQRAEERKLALGRQQIEQHTKQVMIEEEKDIKAKTALQNGDLNSLTPELQQRAMQTKMQEIMQSTEDPDQRLSKWVDFARTTSVVDKRVQAAFRDASASSPVGSDGKLRPEVDQALTQFMAMRRGGLSESTIRAYAGNSYDFMRTAEFLQNGSMDVQNALTGAWEVTQAAPDQRQTPIKRVDDIRQEVKANMESFFEDIEPSIIGGMISGAPSDAKYDEVLTSEVEEAAANSTDMQDWLVRRAEEYAKIYPSMKPEAIMNLTKQDMSRWEYAFGKMVAPTNGQSLSEMMGLGSHTETLVSNSAVLYMMQTKKDDLFPKGTAERSIMDNLFQGKFAKAADVAGDDLVGIMDAIVFGGPKKDDPSVVNVGDVLFAASERRQALRNEIPSIGIQPQANGMLAITLYRDREKLQPVGAPIQIQARRIGDLYKNRMKGPAVQKATPGATVPLGGDSPEPARGGPVKLTR